MLMPLSGTQFSMLMPLTARRQTFACLLNAVTDATGCDTPILKRHLASPSRPTCSPQISPSPRAKEFHVFHEKRKWRNILRTSTVFRSREFLLCLQIGFCFCHRLNALRLEHTHARTHIAFSQTGQTVSENQRKETPLVFLTFARKCLAR